MIRHTTFIWRIVLLGAQCHFVKHPDDAWKIEGNTQDSFWLIRQNEISFDPICVPLKADEVTCNGAQFYSRIYRSADRHSGIFAFN